MNKISKKSQRVHDRSGTRDNNFDTMRIVAALCVVISHAFPLSYGATAVQPLFLLSHHQTALSTFSVYVFFVLSGFLITGSFERQPPHRFVLARGLRLLPGLAVVLFILTFIVGPVLTTIPLGEYFCSGKIYHFVATNLSLTGYAGDLPGVFETNPVAHVVDGSLWTLKEEAKCYLLVFLVGIAGLPTRYTLAALWAVALCCSWRWEDWSTSVFGSCFLGGAVLYAWKPPFRWWIAVLCAVIWTASLWTGFRLASATVGAYIIIYIGLSPVIRLPKVTRWGDLSYGTYIWAWPVQQSVTLVLGSAITWYLNVIISTPIIILIAGLSWQFVEGPALNLKKPRRLMASVALDA
jgi:peptidoglycan/LPS O-acetylase OafA/YrhL